MRGWCADGCGRAVLTVTGVAVPCGICRQRSYSAAARRAKYLAKREREAAARAARQALARTARRCQDCGAVVSAPNAKRCQPCAQTANELRWAARDAGRRGQPAAADIDGRFAAALREVRAAHAAARARGEYAIDAYAGLGSALGGGPAGFVGGRGKI